MQRLETLADAFCRTIPGGERRRLWRLRLHWPLIVGRWLDARCRPLELRDHTLVVAVPSRSWADTLERNRHLLLEALTRRLPELEIRHVDCRVRYPKPSPQIRKRVPVGGGRPLPPKPEKAIQELAQQIPDPATRRAFIRCFRRAWRRRHPSNPECHHD